MKAPCIGIAIAFVSIAFAADHPDFTGIWRLDNARSGMVTPPDVNAQNFRRIRQFRNVIAITEIQRIDGKENQFDHRIPTNSSEESVAMDLPEVSVNVTSHGNWVGDRFVSETIIVTARRNETIREVWTLSNDGRTLIDEMARDGQPPRTLIYTKQ